MASMKHIEKIIQIIMSLSKGAWKGSANEGKMMDLSASLTARLRLNAGKLSKEYAECLLGFYIYCKSRPGLIHADVLSTFFHDIGGIIREDFGFLPRSYSYREFYDESILNQEI